MTVLSTVHDSVANTVCYLLISTELGCKLSLCLIKPTLLNDLGERVSFSFYLSACLRAPATLPWEKETRC
jgi:hypothetical protein